MKERFTYEMPSHPTATAVVGLSHRGSRVGFQAAAAMRQPYGVFAVVEKRNGTERVHYVLKDHLGSWTTITNANGAVEREQSFDAWGNLRNPDTWTNYTAPELAEGPMLDRGFTGHEHLMFGQLINMNGRMYDPVMSSFLSVDKYVQNPDNSQNFNRYSYCLNNPLKYTDPSGWVMVGGMTPYVSLENWGVSYYRPVHGPSTLTNAYNMLNIALYGNLYGPQYLVDGGGGVGTTSSSVSGTYGYYVAYQANSVYNYTFASTKLQLIRNWQYNPSYRSNSDLRGAGITNVTVGVVRYGNGYQKSYYTYTVSGRTYSKVALDYVGRSQMECYSMTNQSLEAYDEGNGQLNKANLVAQSLGIPLGTIDNGMNCAAKAYHNVSVLTGNLSKAQYVSALTKEGYGMLRATRGLGVAGACVSVGCTAYQTYNYRLEGGKDPNVYAKSTLDVVMVGVGFLGPVGFGISTVYFITDIATGGFYGWGAIPDNYQEDCP